MIVIMGLPNLKQWYPYNYNANMIAKDITFSKFPDFSQIKKHIV